MSLALDQLNTALAIVGRTGSGKSYAAKGCVEHLLDAGRRVCIIDPTGAWWGLRRSADGAGEGFPVVIFGGDHADVPISEASGAKLGDLIASGEVSQSIIDVSDMSTSAQVRFLTELFEHLYTSNKAALHLVLDEADVMAPQNPLPETRRLQGVVNKIVRRGRIKGFRPLMITQRPQVIDKSVLSQVSTLVAMKLTAPQDRKAILDWVKACGGAAEMVDQLPSLPRGSGMVWDSSEGSMQRVDFPLIRTFDSSRAPEHGEAIVEPQPLSSIDVQALREALDIEPAKTKAAKAEARPSADALAAAEQRGYERGKDEALRAVASMASELAKTMAIVEEGSGRAKRLLASFSAFIDTQADEVSGAKPFPTPASISPAPIAKQEKRAATPAGSIGPEWKPLSALASVHPAGMTEAQWAVAAGFKRTSGTWSTYKGRLRKAEAISQTGDLFFATDHGLSLLGDQVQPMPPPGMERVEFWLSRIPAVGPMLRELARIYPKKISREQLAQRLGMSPTSGTFSTYLGRLRTPGLIVTDRDGVCASRELMEGPNGG